MVAGDWIDIDVGRQVAAQLTNRGYGYQQSAYHRQQGFVLKSKPILGPKGESLIIVGRRSAFDHFALDIDLSELPHIDSIEAHLMFWPRSDTHKPPVQKPHASAWFDGHTILENIPLPGIPASATPPQGYLVASHNGMDYVTKMLTQPGRTLVTLATGLAGAPSKAEKRK